MICPHCKRALDEALEKIEAATEIKWSEEKEIVVYGVDGKRFTYKRSPESFPEKKMNISDVKITTISNESGVTQMEVQHIPTGKTVKAVGFGGYKQIREQLLADLKNLVNEPDFQTEAEARKMVEESGIETREPWNDRFDEGEEHF